MSAITLGLGLDSLLVCLAIAPFVAQARDRVLLAGVFGVADACATFAASHGGSSIAVEAAVIVLAALAIALASPRLRRVSVLPVLLSIDNLLVPLAPGDALAAGVASGVLALVGFILGEMLFGVVPRRLHAPVAIAAGIVALIVVARG